MRSIKKAWELIHFLEEVTNDIENEKQIIIRYKLLTGCIIF